MKSKQFESFIVVDLPEGASDIRVDNPTSKDESAILNWNIKNDSHNRPEREFDLPPGSYSLVGFLKELDEDEAAELVEGWDSPTGGDDYQDYYKNYNIKTNEDYLHAMDFTNPLESLRSLLLTEIFLHNNPKGEEPKSYDYDGFDLIEGGNCLSAEQQEEFLKDLEDWQSCEERTYYNPYLIKIEKI